MKTLFVSFLLALSLLTGCTKSLQFAKHQLLRIHTDKAFCTATQVKAASGQTYVLTAAHCLDDGDTEMWIEVEGKRAIPRKVIEISKDADLALLEGVPRLEGLDIAKRDPVNGDRLVAYSHGGALDTYFIDGSFVQFRKLEMPIFEITSDQDLQKCASQPKFRVLEVPGLRLSMGPHGLDITKEDRKVCMFSQEMSVVMINGIVHGSSGGPILNADHEVMGVVTAIDEGTPFGYLTKPDQIRKFLSAY